MSKNKIVSNFGWVSSLCMETIEDKMFETVDFTTSFRCMVEKKGPLITQLT